MPTTKPRDGSPDRDGESSFALTLFVNGASSLSARAVTQARQLCERHLPDSFHLSVIDVHDNPAAVMSNRVVVTPTLIRTGAWPTRRFAGDLAQTARVLVALDLPLAE